MDYIELYKIIEERNLSTITEKQLSDMGFDSDDIEELKKLKIIYPDSTGGFKIDMLRTKRNLFFYKILNEKYDESIPYLKWLLKYSGDAYKKDYNFYLYLLSHTTPLSGDLAEYATQLEIDDILLDENIKISEEREQNIIRQTAYDEWFSRSLSILSKYSYSLSEFTISRLLGKCIDNYKDMNKQILELVKNKKYDDVKAIYTKKATQSRLIERDYKVLYLIKLIGQVTDAKEIPKRQPINTMTVDSLIKTNNFDLALSVLNERNSETETYISNITISLLEELISQISSLESDNRNLSLSLQNGDNNANK